MLNILLAVWSFCNVNRSKILFLLLKAVERLRNPVQTSLRDKAGLGQALGHTFLNLITRVKRGVAEYIVLVTE